jgi:hypothetical protein
MAASKLRPTFCGSGASIVTLKEFFFGRRIVLRSLHPKDWVIDQIKLSVGSPFSLLHYGVSGGVFSGRLYLAHGGFLPMVLIGYRPIFSGRLVEAGRDTELHAIFVATWHTRALLLAFFAWWYFILTIISGLLLIAAFTGGMPTKNLLFLGMLPFFWIALPGFHFIVNRKADAHYDDILSLLEREAGLVPVDGAALAAG